MDCPVEWAGWSSVISHTYKGKCESELIHSIVSDCVSNFFVAFLYFQKQARSIANVFHRSIGPAFVTMKEKEEDSAGTLKGKLDRFIISTPLSPTICPNPLPSPPLLHVHMTTTVTSLHHNPMCEMFQFSGIWWWNFCSCRWCSACYARRGLTGARTPWDTFSAYYCRKLAS